jgi:hypothetical protein
LVSRSASAVTLDVDVKYLYEEMVHHGPDNSQAVTCMQAGGYRQKSSPRKVTAWQDLQLTLLAKRILENRHAEEWAKI